MTDRTRPDDLWLEVGRVTKPHGRNGAFVYRPHSGQLSGMDAGTVIRLVTTSGNRIDTEVASIRPFKKGGLLELPDNPDEPDRLRGAVVWMRRSDLPPLDEGEVYVNDLLGLTAVLPDGRVAGVVVDATDAGNGIVLFVDGDLAGTVLYHADWVGDPDFDKGTLPLAKAPIAS